MSQITNLFNFLNNNTTGEIKKVWLNKLFDNFNILLKHIQYSSEKK